MKHLIGPAIFLLILSAGIFLVPSESDPPVEFVASPPVTEPLPEVETISEPPDINKDFIPEFTGLPSFDELYPDEIKTPDPRNLLDLSDNGIFRRSEAVAKNNETWLIMTESGGTYSLESAKASVKNLNSVSWPGEEPDAKVAFNTSGKAQIAFRNLAGLKPGKITTLFRSNDGVSFEMADGFKADFKLGENLYTLRTSKGLTADGIKVAVLVLESEDGSQVIHQVYHSEMDRYDIIGNLLWAGDMDGDGKLDLYFDEFNEKGVLYTELHLSSHARGTDLVKKVASFSVAGC